MPYLSLSSDDYNKHFLTGFAHLQEEQDFVDLTIAVDEHFVKVHKNVIALASPYLRDIMKKSPSENLVIYLNNVNYKDFSFLLEYIYQGEVNVPEERLQCFIQLAQSLHITGIADSVTSEMICLTNKQSDNTHLESNKLPTDLTDDNFEENNSSELVTACFAVNTDHNHGQISEGIQVSNREQEFATQHVTTNEEAVKMKTTGEIIYNIKLEDFEENIPIDETNYIQVNSNVKENAIPENTILEPYEITLNSEEAGNIIPASIIDTNNILSDIEMTDNIATNNKEMSKNIPTDTNQVDSSILEIAKDKGIPLNSIAMMKDDEIPTDIHIVISKPNDADTDENKPYAVTVKPLSSLMDAEGIPHTIGSNFQFDKDSVDALKVLTQFSVTERGCIQIIVNRYIYNSHHVAHGGRKHRWRCADYRKNKCPAIIDSLDNNIVLRKGIHNHTYHDDKIYTKHNKSQIFNTLKQAENARNKPSIETVNPEDEDIAKLIDVKHTKKKLSKKGS